MDKHKTYYPALMFNCPFCGVKHLLKDSRVIICDGCGNTILTPKSPTVPVVTMRLNSKTRH